MVFVCLAPPKNYQSIFQARSSYSDNPKSFKSSSTLPIPAIPKLSTNTFATFGDKNAGSVGPRWIFFTPRQRRASKTMTAFCSYQEILQMIGSSLISSSPNTSFNLRAITAREQESLHCPASSTRGIQPISPKFNLLYFYFSQPAITTNFLIAPDFTAVTISSARAST